jgi:hypothetical protein
VTTTVDTNDVVGVAFPWDSSIVKCHNHQLNLAVASVDWTLETLSRGDANWAYGKGQLTLLYFRNLDQSNRSGNPNALDRQAFPRLNMLNDCSGQIKVQPITQLGI